MTNIKVTEKDTQNAIMDYLAVKRIFHYRQNSGAFRTQQGGMYWFGTKGAPDIIAVIDGIYIGIEVKAPKGKQSESQKEFQERLEKAGGQYILAYSVDDVVLALNNPPGEL